MDSSGLCQKDWQTGTEGPEVRCPDVALQIRHCHKHHALQGCRSSAGSYLAWKRAAGLLVRTQAVAPKRNRQLGISMLLWLPAIMCFSSVDIVTCEWHSLL